MPTRAQVTAHVDAALKRALQKLAKSEERTLSKYVERLLAEHVAKSVEPRGEKTRVP